MQATTTNNQPRAAGVSSNNQRNQPATTGSGKAQRPVTTVQPTARHRRTNQPINNQRLNGKRQNQAPNRTERNGGVGQGRQRAQQGGKVGQNATMVWHGAKGSSKAGKGQARNACFVGKVGASKGGQRGISGRQAQQNRARHRRRQNQPNPKGGARAR